MQLSMNLSMELSMELSIDVGRLLLSGMSVRKNSDSCDYFEWNFRDAVFAVFHKGHNLKHIGTLLTVLIQVLHV